MDDPRDEGPVSLGQRLELALERWDDYRQRPLFLLLVLGVAAALVLAAVVSARADTGAPVEDLIPRVALTPTTAEGQDRVLIVHVAGEVIRPGVYELASGSRVLDAITAAGGPSVNADLDLLNLAATAVDGVQIRVPAVGEIVQQPAFGMQDDGQSPVDINTASTSQLERLPGIGPATAERIVGHREEHGPFSSAEQLLEVPGIGPAKLEGLADHVRVS